MAKYAVRVKEILAKTIIVEAESYDEARDKVSEAYHQGHIELDYDCFDDVEFEVSHWGNNAISDDTDVSHYEHLEDDCNEKAHYNGTAQQRDKATHLGYWDYRN